MRDAAWVCHVGDNMGVPPEMYREEAVGLFVCEE
jgi:hypothetical protein